MKSKSMVLIVVGILAVTAVGAAIYFNVLDKNDSNAETTKFLIQDDKGVYFWIEGQGDNGKTALVDSCKNYDVPLDVSDGTYGTMINSIFGIATKEVSAGVWAYWSQYSYVDGEWKYNEISIDKVKTSDVKFIALVYSDGTAKPLSTPADAKVWNHSKDGTVFTIKSNTGLEFKINGTGDKVIDALINATGTYNVPFVASGSPPAGVESIFGIAMAMTEPISTENPYGVWSWWIQKVPTADGTGWESTTKMMNELNTSDTASLLLMYGTETF